VDERLRRRRRLTVLGLTAASLVVAVGAADAGRRLPDARNGALRTTPVAQPDPGDAFDWLDAGIGGAAVLGLGLVAAGTSVVVARRRQQRVLADIQTSRREQHP
jgi:hypothetical protein